MIKTINSRQKEKAVRCQLVCWLALTVLISSSIFAESSSANWAETMFGSGNTGKQLIPELDDAYGVAFKDINGDDLADIYVVRFRELNRLLINQGGEKPFRDMTISAGLGGNLASAGRQNLELGAAVADINNDGLQDIMIAGWDETTRLFRSNGNLEYTDISLSAGVDYPISGNCAVWSDIDLDGDLDCYLTDEHRGNQLYIQNQPGKFYEAAREYGVDVEQISQGAAFGDLDNDGYPDLYVCNWFAPDLLYRNVGGKYFKQVKIPIPHLVDPLRSNSISFGDIDNDGDLDLVVCDRQRTSRLYLNNISAADTQWVFSDETVAMEMVNKYPAYSGIIADFNNDGWQDIFFANIGPNQLFISERGRKFHLTYREQLSSASRLLHYSTGAAAADFDNDGDIDLFLSNKDTASVLYINPGVEPGFLRIAVRGGRSNRDGVGTRISLYRQSESEGVSGLIGFREIGVSQGYLSAGEPAAHFGIDPQANYRAEIRFPSGKLVVRNNLTTGQRLVVNEHNRLLMTTYSTFRTIGRIISRPDFTGNILILFLLISVAVVYMLVAIPRYKWRPRETAGLIGGILLLLFLALGFVAEYGLRSVLLGQLVLLIVAVGVISGFSERILQVSSRRYGYRPALRKFSEQLIFIRSNEELYQSLVKVIHRELKTSFSGLVIEVNGSLTEVAAVGDKITEDILGEINNHRGGLLAKRNGLTPKELKTNFNKLYSAGIRMVVVLGGDAPVAWLLIGERPEAPDYQPEDLDLLAVVASQAALAIDNNRYIEETKNLTAKITETQTREKYVAELETKNRTLEELYQNLKETQSQLIQSEKMSGLGQLVAGVAHELNNPIAFIYANMRELRHYIDDFKNRGVKEIVENLRNFSRLDEAEFKVADIHEGLDATLRLLNNEFKNRIDIKRDYGSLPAIECLPGYLNQVFMNILLNGAQAIEGEGSISIITEAIENMVEIRIKDNGRGIPEDRIGRVFEPFYTTKPVGAGTGLGLSISYGIVERHGGTINVSSAAGRGTTFTIKLPVTHKK